LSNAILALQSSLRRLQQTLCSRLSVSTHSCPQFTWTLPSMGRHPYWYLRRRLATERRSAHIAPSPEIFQDFFMPSGMPYAIFPGGTRSLRTCALFQIPPTLNQSINHSKNSHSSGEPSGRTYLELASEYD